MRSGTDPASACSPRSSGRAADSSSAFRKRSEIRKTAGSIPRFSVLPSFPIELLSRDVPIRTDGAGHTVECAIDEFGEQEPAVVDRAGHGRPSLGDGLEADPAIISFVTDQEHETVPPGLRVTKRAFEQQTSDPAAAKRRLDGQRAEQQRLGVTDDDRQLPHRADQHRPDPRGERQIEQMVDMLAYPVSAQDEAAGTEGALMQALDRLRVVGGFGQDGKREITHQRASIFECPGPVKSYRQEPEPDRPAASSPGVRASPCQAQGRTTAKASPEPSGPSTRSRSADGERYPVQDR